jgi:uncharacterized protein (DUF1697 family)
MPKYAAFLRGINVGGNKQVPMERLKKTFESLGFKNVKTLLATGNVLFEAPSPSAAGLAGKIEDKLKRTFGFEIGTIVRTVEELQALADSNPFKGIKVTPETRLYVTFLARQEPRSGSKLKIPFSTPEKDFHILRVTATEVCSALTLSPNRRTVDLMSILEKEFGKRVTTRNWNTVARVLKAAT